MKKPISPKLHGLLDYALISLLFIVPRSQRFPKKVQGFYTIEGLVLLVYVAISENPTGLVPLIPYKTHAKIDPVNVATFAAQSLLKPIAKDHRVLRFNIAFTIAAAIAVALTDWDRTDDNLV